MKYIIWVALILLPSTKILGQQNSATPSASVVQTLILHQVSGVVQDSSGIAINGATVKLKSDKDSLLTFTNGDGIYIFENVKSPTFVLTFSTIGLTPVVRKYLNNDLPRIIVLDPVVLQNKPYELRQVNVNGTPSVKYKTDTVEYRASDYRVPQYARISELLKKMEGMEVGPDGSLVHQGQQVTKAKLNGKDFAGGDIKQAIQNLPAAIVEKIQVIDDYGDLAAKTGIKDGAPKKALNITTLADKSIGTIALLSGQIGNNDRFINKIAIDNIDANRLINISGDIKKTVDGITSTDPSGSSNGGGNTTKPVSQGTTVSGSPTFSYTNDWNNKITLVGSYTYNFNTSNAVNNSYGQTNYSTGTNLFNTNSTSQTITHSHNFNFKIDYNIDKANYLQVTSNYDHNVSKESEKALINNLNYFTSGFEHAVSRFTTVNNNANSDYGLTALFVHTFSKAGRNFSLQAGVSRTDASLNRDVLANYDFYADTSQNMLLKDSVSHLLTLKENHITTFRSAISFTEPLNVKWRLEFTNQLRNSAYNNAALSDTVLANGELKKIEAPASKYDFSFIEVRTTFDFRYRTRKSDLTLGISFIPDVLSGTLRGINGDGNISTTHTDFKLLPVFRYAYSWSSVEHFQLMYTGVNYEPMYQQIQPFTDKSDPGNILVGNPNLKPAFIHSIEAVYKKYFPNSKFNLAFDTDLKLIDNQVVTNITQATVPVTANSNRTINVINFVNLNGGNSFNGKYSVSKQLDDRRFNLQLNGNVIYNYTNLINNNLIYHSTEWRFIERFGPRITLGDQISINPYVGYDIDRFSSNSFITGLNSIKITKLAIDGYLFFLNNFQFHYDASKNFVYGLANYNLNPLVINMGFEKQLLRQRNLFLTFDVFDLLHQNNFIRQSITPQSATYTLSNTLSRYFLFGVRLNLQKWGGSPKHNGQPLKRRGDGSFIH